MGGEHGAGRPVVRVPHVSLEEQHDAGGMVLPGLLERLLQPGDVCRVTGGVLRHPRGCLRRRLAGVGRGTVPEPGRHAVVRADDVEHGELGAGRLPAHILGIVVLGLDPGLLAEREAGVREEQLPDLGEPLERIVPAVVGAVAIGPLVVARGVDQRIGEGRKLDGDVLEIGVAAQRAAGLDIADMDDPADVRIRIERGDQRRQRRPAVELGIGVGHVADDGIGDWTAIIIVVAVERHRRVGRDGGAVLGTAGGECGEGEGDPEARSATVHGSSPEWVESHGDEEAVCAEGVTTS